MLKAIKEYLESNVHKPLFLVVDDEAYAMLRHDLDGQPTIDLIRLSECCSAPDKHPDFDKLKETLRMIDVDCDSNNAVLLGLGEYLSLIKTSTAMNILQELKDFNLGSARLVVLLRYMNEQAKQLVKYDPRLLERQVSFSCSKKSSITYQFTNIALGTFANDGFRSALRSAEDTLDGKAICANTSLRFPEATCTVSYIANYFEALVFKEPRLSTLSDIGTKEGNAPMWERTFNNYTKHGGLEALFSAYGIDGSVDNDLCSLSDGQKFKNWLTLMYLRLSGGHGVDAYLHLAAEKSESAEEFADNVLYAILSIDSTEPYYWDWYKLRKNIVAKLPEASVAAYVIKTRELSDAAIEKLTDNTEAERREIVSLVSVYGLPECLSRIYPALAEYLGDYQFTGTGIDQLLTSYFKQYRFAKLLNEVSPEMVKTVEGQAVARDFNLLPGRDEIVNSFNQGNTFLCWIDALGVEYLNFIIEYARKRGLVAQVKTGRSHLPTITACNRKFFDEWPSDKKKKIEELDDIKHKDKGGFSFASDTTPSYLSAELDVILDALEQAAVSLSMREYDRVVIASDHGASRLAVLKKQEEKYLTDTKGEHSGRCCPYFTGCDLPFVIDTGDVEGQDRYLVLADYGRFKGSRAANVEVHGGASLEEVVVPTIVLSLKDSSLEVKLLNDSIKADRKSGIAITLFVNKAVNGELSVVCDGVKHICKPGQKNQYGVELPEIKHKCSKILDIFLDNGLVARIPITVTGKSASVDSDFDDLF